MTLLEAILWELPESNTSRSIAAQVANWLETMKPTDADPVKLANQFRNLDFETFLTII